MGNGVSQEQVQEHLERQEGLVRQLQAIIEQQRSGAAAPAMANGAVAKGATDSAVIGAAVQDVPDEALEQEVEAMRAQARAAEQRRGPEDEVDPWEKELPPSSEGWEDPQSEWSGPEKAYLMFKPWLGSMAMPDGFEYGKTDGMPEKTLELEHVHGIRGARVRNNGAWVDAKTVVYFVASLGIVHNTESNTQAFFRGHTDDVTCMAYHPARRIVVTADCGRSPTVCVWRIDSPQEEPLAVIPVAHRRGVASAAFSDDGARLVTAGLDEDSTVTVYDWENNITLATDCAPTARLLDARFVGGRSTEFVTVGARHAARWHIRDDRTLSQEDFTFGAADRDFTAVVVPNSRTVVLGTHRGELLVVEDGELRRVLDAHQGSVYALAARDGAIVSGGKDGCIARWDLSTGRRTAAASVNSTEPHVLKDTPNHVRSLSMLDADVVAAVTLTNCLVRVDFAAPQAAPEILVSGHHGDFARRNFGGELWGLASADAAPRFFTAGEDALLCVWDTVTRRCLNRVPLPSGAHCVACSPGGEYIAVGLSNGAVMFFDGDGNVLASMTKCRRRIQAARFSPSGTVVAVGSADNTIDVYEVADGAFSFKGRLDGHKSVILKMDFSADERYLQTCSQSYELLFFDLEAMQLHKAPRSLRNVEWATFTSILGWGVQGVFPKDSDGTEVNAATRSHDRSMLITAETTGLVKVFNYPCVGGGLDRQGTLTRRPESRRLMGHTAPVTEAVWTANDEHVVSISAGDLSVFQWRVVTPAV